jgi:hypothetical protein
MNTTNTLAKTQTSTTGIAHRIRRAVQLVGMVAVTVSAIVLPAAPASAQTVPTTTSTTTAPVEQQLFAGSLWATLAMENIAGFTAPAFDGNLFSLSGQFAKTRGAVIRFHNFQAASLTAIQAASIEVRLMQVGWVDDQIALEYSVDAWRTTRPLAAFNASNPVPASLTTYRFDGLQSVIATPELARTLEVRLRSVSATGKVDVVSLKLDQVGLIVKGS